MQAIPIGITGEAPKGQIDVALKGFRKAPIQSLT